MAALTMGKNPITIEREGRDSAVGIVTPYGLDVTGIESRCGAKYTTPVQTGSGPTQPPIK